MSATIYDPAGVVTVFHTAPPMPTGATGSPTGATGPTGLPTGATGPTGSPTGATGVTGSAFKSMSLLSKDADQSFWPKTGAQRVEVILGGSGTWATLAPTQASLGNGFGEHWSAICDMTMGLADNTQFRVNVQDGTAYQSDGVTTLHVQPVDVVWGNPTWQTTFETYYFGHTAEETPKVLHPYTERRLDAALAWVEQNYPGSSTTKRTISGGSMGAWGAMSYAIRRANKFAAIFASRPRLRYNNSGVGHVSVPDYKWAALDQPNVLIEGTTETAGQHLDLVAYAANPANTMPFIAMCVGRLDGYMWFPDYVDFVAACRATNRGFVFAWNNGDHGGGDIMASAIATSYNRGAFEVGVGYPVLSGSSLDQNPAVDLVGGINLGFSWRNIVETTNGWSCEITNLNGDCTVNVKPHSNIFTASVAAKPIAIAKNVYTSVSFSSGAPTGGPTGPTGATGTTAGSTAPTGATGTPTGATGVTASPTGATGHTTLPIIDAFLAEPYQIELGRSAMISWISRNSAGASLDNGIGRVGASGSMIVTPTQSTSYTLTVDGVADPVTITIPVVAESGKAPASSITIRKFPTLDLSQTVTLDGAFTGHDRYERWGHPVVLTGTAISMGFRKCNIEPGGGVNDKPLTYPKYGLLVGDGVSPGVLRATCSTFFGVSGSVTGYQGTLVGSLGGEPDGPIFLELVAFDAAGNQVANPTESLVPWGAYIDRTGNCKNATHFIMQTMAYDWTHSGGPVYAIAFAPKALIGAVHPLSPRPAVPFNTALPYTEITRINRTPVTDSDSNQLRRPVTTLSGIVCSDNYQAYQIGDIINAPPPFLPLVDGPRGQCTTAMVTAIWVGLNSSLFCCDPYSFYIVRPSGQKMTLAGIRHKTAPFWGNFLDSNGVKLLWPDVLANDPNVEIIGNWDSSIPLLERFPWECWGIAWDARTTFIDRDDAHALMLMPANEPFHGAVLRPHRGAGAVAFLCDRHGYVLKLQFNGLDHTVPPIITRFITANDPWGIVYDNGILYVTERLAHRISKWDATTGAYLGDVIANPAGNSMCYLDGLRTATLIGLTLAQARAVPILAPEGLQIQDGYLYWGQRSTEEVRRIKLSTGVIETVCRPPIDGNSHFIYLALSDGTFGPRGTVFTVTWSSGYFGRPMAYLPTPGIAADGTPLTNSVWWDWAEWQSNSPPCGRGTTIGAGYPTAVGIANGVLACGTSQDGLDTFIKADPALDPVVNYARIGRGRAYYYDQKYELVHGHYGFGFLNLELPWGENADTDYWLTLCGHRQ